MFNKIYIKLLSLLINFIDSNNKKKITNFFKKNLNDNPINILDIGAHTGETISLFCNNFSINKILAFEANPYTFAKLEKIINRREYSDKIKLFNCGLGEKKEKKNLTILNESSSSTFNKINKETNYYNRKEKFLSIFKAKSNIIKREILIEILPLSDFQELNSLEKIDILKIDTEGYELNILKGLNPNDFKKIKYIYFEHHYDLMIQKNYTYRDIKNYLNKNNFYLKFKIKMNFRKTFEYIYENKKK